MIMGHSHRCHIPIMTGRHTRKVNKVQRLQTWGCYCYYRCIRIYTFNIFLYMVESIVAYEEKILMKH